MVLTGRNFGDDTTLIGGGMSGGRTYSSSSSSSTLSVVSCALTVSHTEIQCVVPEGTGSNYQWYVLVANQRSAPYSSVKASYGAPNVTKVLVRCDLASRPNCTSSDKYSSYMSSMEAYWRLGGVKTNGNGFIILQGSNFGSSVQDMQIILDDEILPENKLIMLEPHTLMQVFLPSGTGVGHTLQMKVGGLSSGPLERRIQYGRPRVLSLEVDSFENLRYYLKSRWVVLRIYGENFGSLDGYHQHKTSVALDIGTADATVCAFLPERPLRFSAEREVLYCNTTTLNGALTVTVDSQRSNARLYDLELLMAPPVVTMLKVYDGTQELTDSVSLNTFSTSATGSNKQHTLRVYCENIFIGKKYEVVFGRKQNRPVPPEGLYRSPLTVACANANTKLHLPCQSSVGGDTASMPARFLEVTVPKGIGSELVVVVRELSFAADAYYDVVSSSDANTQSTISFAVPLVLDIVPNSGPTLGGNVTLFCTNCGSADVAREETALFPIVTIGDEQCVVHLWRDGHIECATASNVGRDKMVVVSVAGQASSATDASDAATVRYSYHAPTLYAATINKSTTAQGAQGTQFDSICGGALLRLSGRNFGGSNTNVTTRIGNVNIGNEPCLVTFWNNTNIVCTSGPNTPGKKTIQIVQPSSHGRSSSFANTSYSVASPSVVSFAPTHGPTSQGGLWTIHMNNICTMDTQPPSMWYSVEIGAGLMNCTGVNVVLDHPHDHLSSGTITCALPESKGGKDVPFLVRVQIGAAAAGATHSRNQINVEIMPTATFDFDPPTLRKVTPSKGLRVEGKRSVVWFVNCVSCSHFFTSHFSLLDILFSKGGTYILLEGNNFGLDGGTVYIEGRGGTTECVHAPMNNDNNERGHTLYACQAPPGYGSNNVVRTIVEHQVSNALAISYGLPMLKQLRSAMTKGGDAVYRVDALGERISFEQVINIPYASLLPEDGVPCRGDEGCSLSVLNASHSNVYTLGFNETVPSLCSNPTVKRSWVNTHFGDEQRIVYPTSGKEALLACDLPSGVVGPVEIYVEVLGTRSKRFQVVRTCRGERILEGGSIVQPGYYGILGKNCTQCPKHSTCSIGASSPIAQEGFWSEKNADGSFDIMTCKTVFDFC